MSVTPNLRFGLEFARKTKGETARRCIQCGKCATICPLVRLREDFSPIEIVKGVLLGLEDLVLSSDLIWRCLSCQACAKVCPAGIKFPEFIGAVREVLMEKGVTQYYLKCRRCGKAFTTTPVMEFAGKSLPKGVNVDSQYLMLCPDCKPYILLDKSAPWYGKGIV